MVIRSRRFRPGIRPGFRPGILREFPGKLPGPLLRGRGCARFRIRRTIGCAREPFARLKRKRVPTTPRGRTRGSLELLPFGFSICDEVVFPALLAENEAVAVEEYFERSRPRSAEGMDFFLLHERDRVSERGGDFIRHLLRPLADPFSEVMRLYDFHFVRLSTNAKRTR